MLKSKKSVKLLEKFEMVLKINREETGLKKRYLPVKEHSQFLLLYLHYFSVLKKVSRLDISN